MLFYIGVLLQQCQEVHSVQLISRFAASMCSRRRCSAALSSSFRCAVGALAATEAPCTTLLLRNQVLFLSSVCRSITFASPSQHNVRLANRRDASARVPNRCISVHALMIYIQSAYELYLKVHPSSMCMYRTLLNIFNLLLKDETLYHRTIVPSYQMKHRTTRSRFIIFLQP